MERGIHILTTLCSVLAVGRCGDVQVVGSSGPILAVRGDDITLPCSLNPLENAVEMTVHWTRFDLTDGTHVHAYVDRREIHEKKNPSYKYRTMLFEDELEKGNVSLKLSRVRLSDEGNYTCFIPTLGRDGQVIIQLKVVAISQPVISVLGHRDGYVDLQCEAKTRYPDPQMKWLDRDGHARFGDVSYFNGCYTVRSNVTVKETDTESLTCEVELETSKGDSLSATACDCRGWIIGLCVHLAVTIPLILYIVWFRWRLKGIRDSTEIYRPPSQTSARIPAPEQRGPEGDHPCSDTVPQPTETDTLVTPPSAGPPARR